jgi:hypothetical protein
MRTFESDAGRFIAVKFTLTGRAKKNIDKLSCPLCTIVIAMKCLYFRYVSPQPTIECLSGGFRQGDVGLRVICQNN